MVTSITVQIVSVFYVVLVSPLVKGVLASSQAKLQGRPGPNILQPYFDLFKLLHKQPSYPKGSVLIRIAPAIAFASPIVFATLIPVLTAFPLYLAISADMVASGFVLGVGSFVLNLAAMDAGSPYTSIGVSRSRFIATLMEPTVLLVFMAVGYVANATVPFVASKALESLNPDTMVAHTLIVLAFTLFLIAETANHPVDNASSLHEISPIDSIRAFEYGGPPLAAIEWSSMIKFVVLLIVLDNVLIYPFGLAAHPEVISIIEAIILVTTKLCVSAFLIAIVNTSVAKIRIIRAVEYSAISTGIALIAVLAVSLGGAR